MFLLLRPLALLTTLVAIGGCALPLATPPPTFSHGTHEISLALMSDPSLASVNLATLVHRANYFTSGELGVNLKIARRTELNREAGMCLGTGRLSAALLRGWRRPANLKESKASCKPHHALPPVDIILVALASEGRFTDLLDARFQGIAERVGGVGHRKNNLAVVYLTGDPDFDTRVILHELGHLLGASHTGAGFMIDDSILLNLAMGFSDQSRQEISAAFDRKNVPFRSPSSPVDFASRDGAPANGAVALER